MSTESKVDDGGPAYPQIHQEAFSDGGSALDITGGMTLRDYFAGQVLADVMASTPLRDMDGYFGRARDGSPHHQECVARQKREIAQKAYAIADAMLAARKGGSDAE